MKQKLFGIAVGLLLLSSCMPPEVDRTITDIGEIVNQSRLLVSTVDGLGSHESPEERVAALRLAEAASRASWLALSEADSKDSVSKKNEKIAWYLSKVRTSDLRETADTNLEIKEESLRGAIRALRDQLDANTSVLFLHPEIGDSIPRSIPFTTTHHLNQIRDRASETITTANLLLETLR